MNKNKIYCGNSLEVLKMFPENHFDSVVTDPPYGIGFMGKAWDSFTDTNNYGRTTKGQKERESVRSDGTIVKGGINSLASVAGMYDRTPKGIKAYQEWCYLWAVECLRVLKPGGHLLASNSSRMYHRMACAIEDAGFEIRDQIMWVYGSGFPKSLNIGKALDKTLGAEREKVRTPITPKSTAGKGTSNELDERPWLTKARDLGYNESYGNIPITEQAKQYEGWGTALKPAHEPIVMARKPLSEKTVALNVLKWGTGGINIDDCRVGTEKVISLPSKSTDKYAQDEWSKKNKIGELKENIGRFPANFIHDGSDEVLDLFPDTKSGALKPYKENHKNASSYRFARDKTFIQNANSGSAARFFYCPKASKAERNKWCEGLPLGEPPASARSTAAEGRSNPLGEPRANNHPTVKPIALMQYLIKLVTPSNGRVLDPFMGSGTTLVACKNLGLNGTGIERNSDYVKIAEARINQVRSYVFKDAKRCDTN